jgi:cysteine synthase A
MEFYTNILNTIGNTPLLELKRLSDMPVYAKAEHLNPGGSVKDRVARYIIEEAEKMGTLKPGMTIIEATSGNMGVGVAFVGVHKGYRVLLVMPEDMSEERRKIIRAFGGELVFTPAQKSLTGAVDKVREIMSAAPDDYYHVQQFTNPLNPKIHFECTAREIWRQMEGNVAGFVAGVGSGGTLQGVGTYLKEKDSNVVIAAVEPVNSAALLGHEPGLHQIQGIGDGFIPAVLDTKLIDEVITVSDDAAVRTARDLAYKEGALVGPSAGANVWSALELAKKLGPGKNVVTVLPDRAERYFSTSLI